MSTSLAGEQHHGEVPTTTSLPWYEQTVCFHIAQIDEPTFAQANTMLTIMTCLLLSTHADVFTVPRQDMFIECLLEEGLDPLSTEVLEWLVFLPSDSCWDQEVLQEDPDNYHDAYKVPPGYPNQTVCMAVWPSTDLGIRLSADNVYMWPVVPGTQTPEETPEV